MNIEKEIRLRFPNIDCKNWKVGNWLILNNRKCRLKNEFQIIFVTKGIANYIYQFRFGYWVRAPWGALSIFFKNSERYKIFQIIADYERWSNI